MIIPCQSKTIPVKLTAARRHPPGRMTKMSRHVRAADGMALGHAILASLNGGAKTGYELAKQFGADGFYWRATHQQIYRELARLEEGGLVNFLPGEPGPRGERNDHKERTEQLHQEELNRLSSQRITRGN